MRPTPFTIHIGDDVLSDLRARLERVRWPDEIPDAGWQYGTDLTYLRTLVDYWRDQYDWRQHEAALNRFEHFTMPLDGIELHFIHQPGVGPNPLPLLLLHGWPGSVWEFHKLLPRLTDPARFGGAAEDAFTVVAPSLPGYGFSFRPNQKRFDRVAMADTFAKLMTEVLDYPRYCVQGGDIGAGVSARLGAAYPEQLYGIHLNFLSLVPSSRQAGATEEETAYLQAVQHWLTEETGYQWIQGTKPQTLSYGLTDSPVGLAAWIVEKFRSWSDCGGEVEQCFSKDELLTAIMLYWATGAINTSFWPYYARRHGDWDATSHPQRIEVPTAYLEFPHEIIRPPRSMAERVYNIQRWTSMTRGGHFAALEQPQSLASDIRDFFRPFR